jgi:putative transposase
MLRDRLRVSERWACRVVGQHRSTQRYEPTRAEDDQALRPRLREISAERPPVVVPPRASPAARGGVNGDRELVRPIWREEGLWVP